MMDPRGVIASGDPYARKIFEEAQKVPMPNLKGMSRDRVENLLDLIEAESKLEKSQFKGLQISNEPFTDEDRSQGRELFLGHQRLVKGCNVIIPQLLWSVLAAGLVAFSRGQDRSGQHDLAHAMDSMKWCVRLSALFLVVYSITFSLASIDWIMALEPMWFSTMWGVYQFAGMIQATLAATIVVGILLRRAGKPLHGIFRGDHLHDLGKLLLGFSCFWMYIWFSQFMLIWYTNIPEETPYFIARMHGAWGPVVVVSILLNWGIPFFVLLPKPCKRSEHVMMKVAVVVLIGRWIDLTVMIFPPTVGTLPVLGIWEISGACCLIGTFGLLLFKALKQAAPAPVNDPTMEKASAITAVSGYCSSMRIL